jgi:osmoprotectant transport system ATP-binding protein
MIELDGVTKRFGGQPVVDGVSLTIRDGEFCVLIGGSGAGKSTTLRMINRLIDPDVGRIHVDGEDVSRIPAEQLRRRMGYVIQSVGLFPHWTVERNIATVPQLLGWPKDRIRDRVTALLELLRLDPADYRGRYPHQLSGGQQQRIGVARALAADPATLLMDEPFGALDPVTREALRAELVRIHAETGKTIVFVTHDMAEALALATRIVLMDRGRIIQAASPSAMLAAPANDLVRDFIGREDWGLKRLSVETVGQRTTRGETAPGEPISVAASLQHALSEMVVRGTDRLAVVDAAGEAAGVLRLADLVRR